MKREKLTIYRDFMEAIQKVPERSYKKIMNAVIKYAFYGEETELSGMEEIIFKLAKSDIDKNNKRFLNGCKGGRNKTKLEPNDNQTETKTEPNHNQSVTKPKPNSNQTITKTEPNNNQNITKSHKEEREKENAPIKENPPEPLKENISPQENKEREENISPHTACAHACIGEDLTTFEERYKRFIAEHPNIQEDYCGHYLLEIDFDLLSEEIEKSKVLQNQTSLEWLSRQWRRIKGGYYRNFEKPKRESGMDILAKLHEKYKREEAYDEI